MQGCKISVEQALMGCSESSTLDLRANVLEGLTGKQLDKSALSKIGLLEKRISHEAVFVMMTTAKVNGGFLRLEKQGNLYGKLIRGM